MKEPLVTIMIPNYNYARFLDECIQSAINQTYENLEIIVLDNASSDDSIKIAKKYEFDKRIHVYKNPLNVMTKNYCLLEEDFATGKYVILLGADDYLYSDFIKSAVEILEKHPNIGYVQGEKNHVSQDGKVICGDPFYKCSFWAPGENAMPIYMMATVALPSQVVIRKTCLDQVRGYDKEIDHMVADRLLWFYLSEICDMAYIREISAAIRLGATNQTALTMRNFQHPILCYLTLNDFIKYAYEKGYEKVYIREKEAYARLAEDMLETARQLLLLDEFLMAEKYLTFAAIVDRNCKEKNLYQLESEMIGKGKVNKSKLEMLRNSWEDRKRNYEPPKGYRELVKGVDYGRESKDTVLYSNEK